MRLLLSHLGVGGWLLVAACGDMEATRQGLPPMPPAAAGSWTSGASSSGPAAARGGADAAGGTSAGSIAAGSGAGGASSGSPGTAGASPGTAGSSAGTAGASAVLPPAVLAFTATTEFRHESIEPAVAALTAALVPLGIAVEASADASLVTPAQLARFGAVVLVSVTGKPYGDPGAVGIAALTEFVNSGGGLVGLHGSTYSYMDQPEYVALLGANYGDHPGDVHTTSCYPEGNHVSVSRLPSALVFQDEFYTFIDYRADNQVVLRCDSVDKTERILISWYRSQGRGRVFYTALGHTNAAWQDARLVNDHVVPAILWALGR